MIRLADIFQDCMTLQRGKPIRIWGSCEEDGWVETRIDGEPAAAEAVSAGDFSLTLPEREAAENVEMEIRFFPARGTEDLSTRHPFRRCESVTLHDVDIGEVWIAGGQSNMEFPLKYDAEAEQMISAAADEHFRFYDVGKYSWEGERALGYKDDSHWDRWMKYEPQSAPYFSAVGVYFALRLRSEEKVPVAVVGCNWGGTPAAAWVERKRLEDSETLRVYTEEFDRAVAGISIEAYKERLKRTSGYEQNPRVAAQMERRMKTEIMKKPGILTRLAGKLIVMTGKTGPYDPSRPGGLYEQMVSKIAGYSCRGILWYQGEADWQRPQFYRELLGQVIESWRGAWELPQSARDTAEILPFLLVQLPSYLGWKECPGQNYHLIREAQQQAADQMKAVYLASVMDAGSKYDIHPKQKRPAGERLANLALHYVYGKEVSCEAPRIEQARQQGREIRVAFSFVPEYLKVCRSRQEAEKGDALSDLFEVKDSRGKIAVKAEAEGKEVRLTCSRIPGDGATVSFAYRPYAPMTLFADNGLPARPEPPTEILQ